MTAARSIFLKLPAFLRRPLSNTKSYVRRLRIWGNVITEIRGAGPRDRAVLRRAALAAPFESLKGLNRWRDPMVGEDVTVRIQDVGLFHVRAGSDDLSHVLPSHEQAVYDRIRAELEPGDIFVDAGANIGFYTVLASRLVGPKGRVIAVEMMPDTLKRLNENIRLNELTNVTVVANALSDTEGQIVRASVTEGEFGQASISQEVGQKAGKKIVEVSTTTLERVLDGIDSVKLMKMDLEGVEIQAISGAGPAINRIRSIIFEDWTGSTQARDFWKSMGFSVSALNRANAIATRDDAAGSGNDR